MKRKAHAMSHTVLLVDDDENVLYSLARALRQQPYSLYTAKSAEEAMMVLKTRNVDVVVADDRMPGMCGSDLLVWVASHYPDVMRILLTGLVEGGRQPPSLLRSSPRPLHALVASAFVLVLAVPVFVAMPRLRSPWEAARSI